MKLLNRSNEFKLFNKINVIQKTQNVSQESSLNNNNNNKIYIAHKQKTLSA